MKVRLPELIDAVEAVGFIVTVSKPGRVYSLHVDSPRGVYPSQVYARAPRWVVEQILRAIVAGVEAGRRNGCSRAREREGSGG